MNNPKLFFKDTKGQILVDVPILEVYLPEDYASSGLYEMVGNKTEWYGVANYKGFKDETEMDNRDNVPTYPMGICGFITSQVSETDILDVRFVKNGVKRHSIVLRFFKGDAIAVTKNIIKSVDNLKLFMSLLENGKLENIPVNYIPELMVNAQNTSNIKLTLSQSYFDVIAIEHYRDPSNPYRKYRQSDMKEISKSGDVRAVNAREESITATTFQMVTFEDINTSLVASCNKDDRGIRDEATDIERIITGKPMK